MKRIWIAITAALLAVTLCACSGDAGSGTTSGSVAPGISTSETTALPTASAENPATTEKPSTTTQPIDPTKPPILGEDERMNKDKTYSVLFIGSSRFFFNNGIWKAFSKIAADAGYTVKVDSVTGSGYYLDQFLDPNDPYGLTLARKLKTKKFDFAIIQEISTCPILDYARFERGVTGLYEMLSEKGIQTVLQTTWGSKAGEPGMVGRGETTETMTEKLAQANQKIAAKLRLPVSWAGHAFCKAYLENPEIEWYADMGHPSPAGTFLQALCDFVTLTGEDPTQLPCCGTDWGLSEQNERDIQQAVADTVYARLR